MNDSVASAVDIFGLSDIDLTNAASSGNYTLIKKWIEKVWTLSSDSPRRRHSDDSPDDIRQLVKSNTIKRCSTPVMTSIVGKMIRAAALDGKVAIVGLLRSYGK